LEVGSFSYWFDKPWFHTEGRLADVLIIPSSWGSQLGGHLHAIRLPDVLQANPHARHSTMHDPYNMAFRSLGAGHGGSAKTAPSEFTHLLVAVDKFTKWVEAKPIRKLDGKTALKFVKDNVVRFGIPHSIITDNGSNLSQGEVEEYCHHNRIRLDLATVAHP
jgi:hypothetical protein